MARRIDSNQREIVAALRAAGATVQDLHFVGHGCTDILVGMDGVNYLFEVKGEHGELTPAEERFFREWEGQVHIVRSVEEALEMVEYACLPGGIPPVSSQHGGQDIPRTVSRLVAGYEVRPMGDRITAELDPVGSTPGREPE